MNRSTRRPPMKTACHALVRTALYLISVFKCTMTVLCGIQISVNSLMTCQTKLRRRIPKQFYSSLVWGYLQRTIEWLMWGPRPFVSPSVCVLVPEVKPFFFGVFMKSGIGSFAKNYLKFRGSVTVMLYVRMWMNLCPLLPHISWPTWFEIGRCTSPRNVFEPLEVPWKSVQWRPYII
jgi:hypothetical protein